MTTEAKTSDSFNVGITACFCLIDDDLNALTSRVRSDALDAVLNAESRDRRSVLRSYLDHWRSELASAARRWFSTLHAIVSAHSDCLEGQEPTRWAIDNVQVAFGILLRLPALYAACEECDSGVRDFVELSSGEASEPDSAGPWLLPWWADAGRQVSCFLGGVPFQPLSGENIDGRLVERLSPEVTNAFFEGEETMIAAAIRKALFQASCEVDIGMAQQPEPKVESSAPKKPAKPKDLPPKKNDLSSYLDGVGLTDRQRTVISLRLEYGMPKLAIAKHLGVHRSTVDECLSAATKKVDHAHENGKMTQRRSGARRNRED